MSRSILRTSLPVALAVGVVLNAINLGPAIMGGRSVSWIHLALNFAIPFAVSAYSAWRHDREH